MEARCAATWNPVEVSAQLARRPMPGHADRCRTVRPHPGL